MDANKFGVPYHCYALTLADGREIGIDVGDEEDWGNVQQCFTDKGKECVGWGDADVWTEVVKVVDNDNGKELDVMKWAKECVWNYVDEYSC